MITTDKYINLALKRFISHNRLKDNFLDYLLDGQREHVSRIFPTQGLFTYPATLTHPGTSGNSYVDFSPDPITGSDGEGHILSAIGSGVLIDVPFALAANKDYWFALHYVEKPDGIYLNPRTGSPEYDTWEEQLGRSAAPGVAPTEPTPGNIKFNVNSVCASGVDYSGMTVTVWLNNPQSEDETIAIETLTVTYSAPNNFITMTSGNGLGQSAVSTTAADYTLCLNGIIWEEVATGAGNPFGSDYTILGYLTTNGVPAVTATYDSAVQNDISGGGGHSLQNAYDFTGSGAGKDILANYQAVEITQQNTTFFEDDIVQAALRLSKDGNGATYANDDKDYEVGMDVTTRTQSYGSVLHRVRLVDESGNSYLQKDETVTTSATDRITFTRGSADIEFPLATYQEIFTGVDLVEISGSAQGNNGVYLISSISSGAGAGASYVDVLNLDSSAVTFGTGEVGITANIYRPVSRLGGSESGYMSGGLQVATLGDFFNEYSPGTGQLNSGVGINVPTNSDNDDEIIVVDRNSTDIFKVFADGDVSATGTILSGKGVTATTGGVTATAGGVTATAGNITAVANDIVCTAGDIEVTNAAKNFVYGSARTFYKSYNPYNIEIDSTYAQYIQGTPDYINIHTDPTGNEYAWLAINDIPHGATITAVDVMLDAATTNTIIVFTGYNSTMTWSLGSEAVAGGVWAAATSSSGSGLQMVTKGSLSVSVDTSNKTHILSFDDSGTDPTGTKIYAVRITYTMVNVIP